MPDSDLPPEAVTAALVAWENWKRQGQYPVTSVSGYEERFVTMLLEAAAPAIRARYETEFANASERLQLAREALTNDGYFTEDQVGPDIAPRIIERLAAAENKFALLSGWQQEACAATVKRAVEAERERLKAEIPHAIVDVKGKLTPEAYEKLKADWLAAVKRAGPLQVLPDPTDDEITKAVEQERERIHQLAVERAAIYYVRGRDGGYHAFAGLLEGGAS